MEIAVISDAISSIAYSTQSFGFSNILNRPLNILSLPDTDEPPRSLLPFRVSAASPPQARTLTKRRLRRTRRVRRRISIDYEGEENGIFVFSDGGGFSSGDGYFGGGGCGGGKGWNFGGRGGANWEGFSDNSISDPAFDFVYGVLCWIAMSNCLHFAFKKWLLVSRRGKVEEETNVLSLVLKLTEWWKRGKVEAKLT